MHLESYGLNNNLCEMYLIKWPPKEKTAWSQAIPPESGAIKCAFSLINQNEKVNLYDLSWN